MSIDPIDRLIEGLDADPPPAHAPEWPRPAWQRPAMLLAAMLLIGVPLTLSQVQDGPRLKGPEGVQVELSVVVERDGRIERASSPLQEGDRLFFRASSTPPSEVELSVLGPEGSERLGVLEATAEAQDLRRADGLVGYRPGVPGTYTVTASADPDCPVGACASVVLELP